MTASDLARRVVTKLLQTDEKVNGHLGVQLVTAEPGRVQLAMLVQAHMTNSQQFCHGGMIFSLADTACAYAAATNNVSPATLDASISFLRPAKAGDQVVATAQVIQHNQKVSRCRVDVHNGAGDLLSVYQGSCINRGPVISEAD